MGPPNLQTRTIIGDGALYTNSRSNNENTVSNNDTLTGWYQITAGFSRNVSKLWYAMAPNYSGIYTDGMIDIGLGASGAQGVFVDGMQFGWDQSNGFHQNFYGPFECDIPAGTPVWWRGQVSDSLGYGDGSPTFGLILYAW
jgi:hypothetical protein